MLVLLLLLLLLLFLEEAAAPDAVGLKEREDEEGERKRVSFFSPWERASERRRRGNEAIRTDAGVAGRRSAEANSAKSRSRNGSGDVLFPSTRLSTERVLLRRRSGR